MRRALSIVAGVLWATLAFALDVGGAHFPETARLTPGGPELALNGAGERYILLFKIYALGLYLPQPRNTANDILALKGPKRLLMIVQRDLTGQQVHDYLSKRINDSAQASEMAAVKTRMDDLDRIIDAVGLIKSGGTIALDWVPEQGTVIRVDNAVRGEPIAGEDFYRALLKIWLSERAKSPVLREALLGRGTG